MLKVKIALLFFVGSHFVNAQSPVSVFIQKSDHFFKKYVSNAKVNYEAIAKDPNGLNELVSLVANTQLGTTKNEKLAFYINAYNISVIKGIIDAYPIGSPLAIEGFFDSKRHTVSGESLTLNELENNKIRIYKDARIHFALVCAAISCPELSMYAYTINGVNSRLQVQTEKALNDPVFIRVKPNSKTVYVSEIFKWYRSDFADTDEGVIGYINQFRKDKIQTTYELKYYPYSWKLNKF